MAFSQRLIPRVHHAVTTYDDTERLDDTITTILNDYHDNPCVQAKRSGHSFEAQAQRLLTHRESLTGFYGTHRYDADHNNAVQRLDNIFSFASPHTKKRGLTHDVITAEKAMLAGIPAGNFAVGLGFADHPLLSGAVMAAAATPVARCTDAINTQYTNRGRRADTAWNTYIANDHYEADVARAQPENTSLDAVLNAVTTTF